jgi:predicted phage terminase large subunit-like protein
MQATHILIDEAATNWKEHEVLFLLSRMRSGEYKGKQMLVMSCNPEYGSFLRQWVEFSLDPDGVPLKGTENKVRYFVNLNGKMFWADDEDSLYEMCGKGLTRGVDFVPKSFKFIPATIYDNPILIKNNPEYLASLLAQPRVNQLRYLKGSWWAREDGGSFFKRSMVNYVPLPPTDPDLKIVRAWDLAYSVPTETNKDPDWSCGCKLARDKHGRYYVLDVIWERMLHGDIINLIAKTAYEDGIEDCKLVIPKDGAAGAFVHGHMKKELAELGIYTYTDVMSGHRSKVQRFLPFCALVDSGSVHLVEGSWNERFLTELEYFTGERGKHDDAVDAVSSAFKFLANERQIPVFAFADMSRASNIPSL